MQQLSLIMFSCKHELASIVTHPRNLTGEATIMTNLPNFSGSYLCKQFRLQLTDACPATLAQNIDFRDGNANSTKTAYY